MEYKLCEDNLICCDDNCQRCANLIYDRYMELLKRLPEGSACEARKPFECDITEMVKKED